MRTRGSRSDIGAEVCGEADSSPVAAQRVVVLGEQAGFSMPDAEQMLIWTELLSGAKRAHAFGHGGDSGPRTT